MSAPAGLTREMMPTVFADRLARLGRVWDDLEDYVSFFVANTAPLLDRDDPLLRDNLAHDLRDGLVRLSPDALVADAADTPSSTRIRGSRWRARFASCTRSGASAPTVRLATRRSSSIGIGRIPSRPGCSPNLIMPGRS